MNENKNPGDRELSPEIFKNLFYKFRMSLIIEAHRILRDPYEAEEVVQETFTVLWEKKHLNRVPPEAYRNYLYCAVRNNCMSRLRTMEIQKRKKDRYAESAPRQETSDNGTWELRERINEAVQRLPEQRKWAFIKSHLDNKSYRQVGEEMGLTMETVRSHVKIALKNLRALLSNLR